MKQRRPETNGLSGAGTSRYFAAERKKVCEGPALSESLWKSSLDRLKEAAEREQREGKEERDARNN